MNRLVCCLGDRPGTLATAVVGRSHQEAGVSRRAPAELSQPSRYEYTPHMSITTYIKHANTVVHGSALLKKGRRAYNPPSLYI